MISDKIYIQNKKKPSDKRHVTQRSYDSAYKGNYIIITEEQFLGKGAAVAPSEKNLVIEAIAKKKAAVVVGEVDTDQLPKAPEENPFVNVSEIVDINEAPTETESDKNIDALSALRIEYKVMTGKEPHHLWKESRLKKEIEALTK